MNYFTILSLTVGTALLAQRPFIRFCLKPSKVKAAEKPAARAAFRLVGPGFTALVGITWYRHFTAGVEHSLLAAVLFTLLFVKSLWLVFNFRRFRAWLEYRANRRWSFRPADLNAILLGLLFLFLGVAIYR